MEAVKDIILDDDNDLIVKNGDFLVRESDEQHIVLIINTFVGDWKLFPFCGVGIIRYISSSGQQQTLRRSIEVQLQADGYDKPEVLLRDNAIYSINTKRVNV
jgi:hypothetical protein